MDSYTPAGIEPGANEREPVHFTTKPLAFTRRVLTKTCAETVDRTRHLQMAFRLSGEVERWGFSLTLSQLSYFGAHRRERSISQWRARTADLGFIRPTL